MLLDSDLELLKRASQELEEQRNTISHMSGRLRMFDDVMKLINIQPPMHGEMAGTERTSVRLMELVSRDRVERAKHVIDSVKQHAEHFRDEEGKGLK